MSGNMIIIKNGKGLFIVKKRFLFFWYVTMKYLVVPFFTKSVSDTYYQDLEFNSWEEAKKYIDDIHGK
jgi:hypothetical protein